MIPFSPPTIASEDIDAVVEVLRSGWITSGPVAKGFEEDLTAYCGAGGAVVLNSATAGLELALRAVGVGPGDEVVVPAYTYTASAAVVRHVGAELVLVDSAADDVLPPVEAYLSAVTERTRAVVVVDIAGVPVDVRPLLVALKGRGARDGGLTEALDRPVVIADGAHSLGGALEGTRTGALADLTAFSFHAVKNLTTSEGGALLWRNDLPCDLVELERTIRLESLHGQSKDALSKMTGSSWEYDIVTLGHKFNMPDVLAAIGRSQLARYESMIARRRKILATYRATLEPLGVRFLAHDGALSTSSHHLAIARMPIAGVDERNALFHLMRDRGVATNVHYKPLPMFTAYRALGFDIADFPNAFDYYSTELTLPLHLELSDSDVELVISALADSLKALVAF